MELRSQEVRTLAPENDPLKMGMGWKVEDLSKPQIMVESTFGDSLRTGRRISAKQKLSRSPTGVVGKFYSW